MSFDIGGFKFEVATDSEPRAVASGCKRSSKSSERFISLLTVARYRSRFCIGRVPERWHQATIIVELKYRLHFQVESANDKWKIASTTVSY